MTTVSTPVQTINHPDYRPGHGERRLDRGIVLYGEPAVAWSLWATLYANRCEAVQNPDQDPREGINEEQLATFVKDNDTFAQLVAIAEADAAQATLPTHLSATRLPFPEWKAADQKARFAGYTIARRLHEHAESMREPYVPPVQEDTCHHGVLFTSPCTDCDKVR
jgi:hypothetical protein